MKSESLLRPVWAEIYLDHLAHNIKEIRKSIPEKTILCCVIKANGYGHGSVEFARHLERFGVERFAVATLTEALELRKSGCHKPILILGYTPDEMVSYAIEEDLTLTVYTLEQARKISDESKRLNKKAVIHIKLDTGMSRLGFQPNTKSIEEINRIIEMPNLEIEGLYTHFAAADEADKKEARLQMTRYNGFCHDLEKRNISIPIKHMANSAAIIDLPETHLDMVRAGIMIYGLYPSEEVSHQEIHLKRVMALKARVAHVKEIEEGTGVSYGLTFRAPARMKIATLPVGYADGYTRMLGGKAEVTIQGTKCPVIGRICMDQCMVDVTGLDVHRGDEVTLYAVDKEEGDTVDDVARKLGTLNYEITCMVGRRVPRVYIEAGKTLKNRDDLL
ncbi:MAG: alanine racemase [Tindallia sp. MSAO_Bac2]|nr:MAG: alanine racemase [Tindallia sp. MSAO_Bac2]